MKRIIYFALIIMATALFSCCIGGNEGDVPTTLPPNLVGIDGVVTQDEYDHTASFSGDKFTIYWRVEDDDIVLAIVAKSNGMVALGFDPDTGMQNADMLIGWVDGQETFLFDCFSTGVTGPHPADTDIGGGDDIIEFSGTEADGITTIELVRKMDTGDQYDKAIPLSGSIDIIWAISGDDSFSAAHVSRGGGSIEMDGSSVGGY